MSEIPNDIRDDVIGTRGSDRSREIRLEFEIHRLTADRDEYAAVALAGLGGIVGTPERGYVQDGGPGQLRADFRELRKLVKELTEKVDHLSGPAMTMIACVACARGVRFRDTHDGRCPNCEVERLKADLIEAAEIVQDLRRKLAEAGVEGSPPPWEATIPALRRQWHEALAEVERLKAIEKQYDLLVTFVGESMKARQKEWRETHRLEGEVERLKAERDAWSDEAVRMLKERNAIIALCVKHYHVENRPIWWNLVGITGCDSPAEAVRVAAGLPRSNGEDMRS